MITAKLASDGAWAVVSIGGTGLGIGPEHLPLHETPRLARLADAWRAWVQLARGSTRRPSSRPGPARRDEPVETSQDVDRLTLARIALAQNDVPQAVEALQTLAQEARAAGRVRIVIRALILCWWLATPARRSPRPW